MPTASSNSSARCRGGGCLEYRTAGSRTFSSTVRLRKAVCPCGTRPIRALRSRDLALSSSEYISVSSTDTTPDVGVSMPASMLSKVLLPLPERPVRTVRSPTFRSRSSGRTAARTSPLLPARG